MILSEINLYPVKSCGGFSLPSVHLDRFGPQGDRRWMVVDQAGIFLSQRTQPMMSRIQVTCQPSGITLESAGSAITIPVPDDTAPSRTVQVWDDQVAARDAGDEAAQWLSHLLAIPCRLTYMPESTIRLVDQTYAAGGETVGFADGFPLLLISQSSLDELNRRLPKPVPMNRFRPNLVVSGCEPFAEDGWRQIQIGEMIFDVAKPCSRCVTPSIVQETGQRDPLINRTLAGFRRRDGKIFFGQNLLYQKTGEVNTGDKVTVLN